MLFYLTSLVLPLVPYLEYAVHYEVIVNEHCVDKDKPESDCNGKCYLKKKISNFNLDKSISLDFLFLSTYTNIEYRQSFDLIYLASNILPDIIQPTDITPQAILDPPQAVAL